MTQRASEACAAGAVVVLLALVSLSASISVFESGETGACGDKKPAAAMQERGSEAALALANGDKMDINRASSSDFEMLPGIGPALASRIVAFREKRGRFGRPEELRMVRGIGPKTLTRVLPMVKTNPVSF